MIDSISWQTDQPNKEHLNKLELSSMAALNAIQAYSTWRQRDHLKSLSTYSDNQLPDAVAGTGFKNLLKMK